MYGIAVAQWWAHWPLVLKVSGSILVRFLMAAEVNTFDHFSFAFTLPKQRGFRVDLDCMGWRQLIFHPHVIILILSFIMI